MARQRLRARAGADEQHVLREIAERGPLASRALRRHGAGGMWNWKPAKIVLEAAALRRPARDRRARELPAALRPARARRSRRAPERPTPTRDEIRALGDTARRRARAARSPRRRSPRCGASPAGRARASARTRTRSSPKGCVRKLDVEDGKAPVLVPGGRRARRRRRRSRCSSPRSTTSSGIAPSSSGSSASAT